MNIFIYFFILLLISILLMFLSLFLSHKNNYKDKLSIYECGFMMISKMGIPFSMKFFMIAMLFLVFDLEMMLLFPWSINMFIYNYFYSYIMMLLFFFNKMFNLMYIKNY